MTLEQSKGERAALVKGCQGDWAIVKARWDEFRRGIPPLKPGTIIFFGIGKVQEE